MTWDFEEEGVGSVGLVDEMGGEAERWRVVVGLVFRFLINGTFTDSVEAMTILRDSGVDQSGKRDGGLEQ